MVMRYFGATNVYAETFSSLVDQSAGGIHGQDLLTALETRGWQAQSFRGDAALVQSHLAASRPAVALIQDRPGRFHYVVIVGWSGGRVIVHDPARAPFRLLDEKQFTDAWAQSGYWTLVAAPPAHAAAAAESAPEPHTPAGAAPGGTDAPCGGMVDEGVRLSGTGELDDARRLLELAAAECPASAAPWRELAGIHALKSEWRGGSRRCPPRADPRSWPIRSPRASSPPRLYLDDDPDGALAAWNNVGEPVIDLVNVTGLERTRYLVAARAMALHPKDKLTPASLRAARRRLAELPAAQTTRLSYRPGESGRAQVDAVVLERPLFPTGVDPTRRRGGADGHRSRTGRRRRQSERRRRIVDRIVALVGASSARRRGPGRAGSVRWCVARRGFRGAADIRDRRGPHRGNRPARRVRGERLDPTRRALGGERRARFVECCGPLLFARTHW